MYRVNPSTAMAALFTLLSSQKAGRGAIKPAWVNLAVSSLLSKQIARTGGILGILNVMLGRTDQGKSYTFHTPISINLCSHSLAELQFAQLEQIAKLITTPPKGTSLEVRPTSSETVVLDLEVYLDSLLGSHRYCPTQDIRYT